MATRDHRRPEAGPYGAGRVTGPRRSVAAAVDARHGAFTVDDLAADLARAGCPVATATIYRAVAAMESCGHLERVGSRDGASLYVRCSEADHHHHVVCSGCGRVTTAPCPLAPLPIAPDGFVVTRHEVTLYGLCPACARDERGS